MRNVTGHVTKRDTSRDMSRVTVHVSHATTTTPHPIKSLAGVVRGWSVAKKSSIATTEERPRNDKRMAAVAASSRGVR